MAQPALAGLSLLDYGSFYTLHTVPQSGPVSVFHLAEESMKAVVEKQVPDLPIVSRWGGRGSITRHSWLKTFYLWDISCCLQGDERVPGLKQVEVENSNVRRISLISPLGKANQWSDQPRESVDIGIMNLESRSRDIWEASGVAVTPDPYLNLNKGLGTNALKTGFGWGTKEQCQILEIEQSPKKVLKQLLILI